MEKKNRKSEDGPKPPSSAREERLKAALKANIARRKLQARERGSQSRTDGNDET